MSIGPLAYIPQTQPKIPECVHRVAQGSLIEAVWVNGVGGVTYRIAARPGNAGRYVKYAALGTPESDFVREATRLRWAGQYCNVPQVLEVGEDELGSWLVTRAIEGASAVAPRWIGQPEVAAHALGVGLRALHDALPVTDCEFSWSVSDRLKGFEQRIASGESPDDWSAEYSRLGVSNVRELLRNPPAIDKLVVCHGDACAPNTLLDAVGNFVGHVDMGELGVADRWADLTIAAWSTEWNYGAGYEQLVYQGYGIEADPERISYYRMLWDLT